MALCVCFSLRNNINRVLRIANGVSMNSLLRCLDARSLQAVAWSNLNTAVPATQAALVAGCGAMLRIHGI